MSDQEVNPESSVPAEPNEGNASGSEAPAQPIQVEKVTLKPKKIYRQLPEKFRLAAKDQESLIKALARAFSTRKKVDDPELYARNILKRCLEGVRPDGKPWMNAPKDLQGRLRVYGFDMESMSPISNEGSGRRPKTEIGFSSELAAEIKKDGTVNTHKIANPLSGQELKEFNKRYKAYLEAYPFLNNPADLSGLEVLLKFEIAAQRRLHAILSAPSTQGMSSALDEKIAKNIRDAQEMLGIAGNQRSKLLGNITSGSVADLVKLYEKYVASGKFAEVEMYWRLEELALLMRKATRTFPDGSPELDDYTFGLLAGISLEEAKKIIPNPFDKSLERYKQKYIDILMSLSEPSQNTSSTEP